MIVPMKKIFLIAQKKDVSFAAESLRALGAVHVEHHETPKSEKLSQIKDDVLLVENAIRILENIEVEKRVEGEVEAFEWKEKADEILHCAKKISQFKENIIKRQALINKWEKWGEFDPHDIRELNMKGVHATLCEVQTSKRSECPEGVVLETIHSSGGVEDCLAITKEEIELPFETIPLPLKSLSQEHASQEREHEQIKSVEEKILEHTKYICGLKKVLGEQKEDLLFEQVIVGARDEEDLSLIKGFCPKDSVSVIEQKAKEQKWGVLFEEPTEEDAVPTLLKNPKWVDIVKPVFDLIGVVPGYREIDASAIFLVFFLFFVGMLVGDAGYGLLIASIAGLVHFKQRKAIKEPILFTLIYMLCSTTVLWGVLTGTYFGQQWISPIIPAQVPWLLDEKNIQLLCFFVGAIHLSIAHARRAIVKFPNISFLSELGWISIVWAMFFMARMFVLGIQPPDFIAMFFIVGLPLIMLFTNPNKS